MWKLIFRGRLERDASHEQAVEKLARLLKKSPEDIEKKLFSGRPVKIGTVATEDEAQQYKRAFSKAGAFLEIYEEAETTTPRASDKTGTIRRILTGIKPRTMIAAGGAFLFVVIVAVVGWYMQPVWRVGEISGADAAAANALATEDVVVLAHIDVKRAALLQARLLSEVPVGPLSDEAVELESGLQQAGVNIRENIDDVYAAYFAGEEGAAPAWIVLGDLEQEKVQRWLESRYDLDRVEGDRIYFTVFDESRCEAGPVNVAHVFPGGVLIAPMDRAGQLVTRWRQKAAAEIDLTGWHERQQSQLASVAIYAPSRARQVLPGAAGILLAAVADQGEDIEALYLGAEPTLAPPGVNLSAAMQSSNDELLENADKQARAAVKKAIKSSGKSWPELVPVYQRVEVERAGKTVAVSVRLDADFGTELEDLATSFLSQAFGEAEVAEGADEERIDENPHIFSDASKEELSPYSGERAAFSPQWKAGPFAAAVSSLAYRKGGGLALEIRAEGDELLNVGAQSELAFLKIDDVTDASGNSLLAKPACGPDRNRQEAPLENSPGIRMENGESVHSMGVAGSKPIELAAGITPDQVAAITGSIRYLLPTRVSRTLVDGIAGAVVEEAGMRLFVQAKGSAVGYQLNGNRDALLEIRALNKEGRYLARDGSVWSDNLFGPGESGTLSFHGDVRQIEIIWAQQTKTLEYALLLKSPYPPLAKSGVGRLPQPQVGRWRQLDRTMKMTPPEVDFRFATPDRTAEAGPALVAQNSLNLMPAFGLTARLDIYVPEAMPVGYNLAGGELVIERAILDDGTERPWAFNTPLHFTHESGYWMNGEYRTDPERPWLKASAAVSDPDYPFDSVSGFSGRLFFRVPVDVTNVYLDLPPGSRWASDDLQLQVAEWRENGLYLDVVGDPKRLVAVNVLGASGKNLGGNIRFAPSGDRLRLWVRLSDDAARLEVVLAEDVEHREQRFSLTPPAPESKAATGEASPPGTDAVPEAPAKLEGVEERVE